MLTLVALLPVVVSAHLCSHQLLSTHLFVLHTCLLKEYSVC